MKIEKSLKDTDIQNALHTIIRTMQSDKWRPEYIVGVDTGIIPGIMLGSYLQIPVYSLEYGCSNGWMAEEAFGYGYNHEPKNILIIFDSNIDGYTQFWLKENWQKTCLPDDPKWANTIWGSNVRFATIVNNNFSNFKDMDYIGIENEEDCVITMPWKNWWMR